MLNHCVFIASPAAGILVMKNGEVYGIAEEPDAVKLLGVGPTDHGGVIPPKFPVKIQALCGKQVTSKSNDARLER